MGRMRGFLCALCFDDGADRDNTDPHSFDQRQTDVSHLATPHTECNHQRSSQHYQSAPSQPIIDTQPQERIQQSPREADLLHRLSSGQNTKLSYDIISVREPLAKILAQRQLLGDHEYVEVYNERGSSCFYEEIAGSTTSSATYDQIGNQSNHNYQAIRQEAEVTTSSDHMDTISQSTPVYSVINKATRRNNSCMPPKPPPKKHVSQGSTTV